MHRGNLTNTHSNKLCEREREFRCIWIMNKWVARTIEDIFRHKKNSDRLRFYCPYVLNCCHCVGFRTLSYTHKPPNSVHKTTNKKRLYKWFTSNVWVFSSTKVSRTSSRPCRSCPASTLFLRINSHFQFCRFISVEVNYKEFLFREKNGSNST